MLAVAKPSHCVPWIVTTYNTGVGWLTEPLQLAAVCGCNPANTEIKITLGKTRTAKADSYLVSDPVTGSVRPCSCVQLFTFSFQLSFHFASLRTLRLFELFDSQLFELTRNLAWFPLACMLCF